MLVAMQPAQAPNRFIANTVRRPYATPGGIRPTLRPSTAPRSFSNSVSVNGSRVAPLAIPSAGNSSRSGSRSNTPDDDAVPPVPRLNVPAAPHTSYQPRTLPLTQSSSLGSMPPSTARPPLPESSSMDSLHRIGVDLASDTTMQMDRAMAQLASLMNDDSDDSILAMTEGL